MRRPGACRPDVRAFRSGGVRQGQPRPLGAAARPPAAARTTAPSAAPRRARANSGIAASRGPCRRRAAWGIRRPAHHFPVTALTSACTVSDLPSATAPGSARNARQRHGPSGTRRHTAPPFPWAPGIQTVGHRAQPADGHDRAQGDGKPRRVGILGGELGQCRKKEINHSRFHQYAPPCR